MDWSAILTNLLALLGGLSVVIIATIGGAYWLFQIFAKGWLDARFTERLEKLKHEQALELERARLEINKIFDRSTKLLTKELDVLPTCWSLLDEAHMRTKLVCSWARQSVAVERMSHEQLVEYLDSTEFSDTQKREVLESPEKGTTYSTLETALLIYNAQKSYAEFHNFIVRSGVFIRPDIRKKFDAIALKIADAVRLRQLMAQPNMSPVVVRKELDPTLQECEELYGAIREEVVRVLWADRGTPKVTDS